MNVLLHFFTISYHQQHFPKKKKKKSHLAQFFADCSEISYTHLGVGSAMVAARRSPGLKCKFNIQVQYYENGTGEKKSIWFNSRILFD